MKILALEQETPGTTPAQFEPLLADEAHRLWELYQQGLVRETYFHADQHTAVLILECADVSAAQTVLATLPLVSAGLISFEVIPLIAYPGFARLFGSASSVTP